MKERFVKLFGLKAYGRNSSWKQTGELGAIKADQAVEREVRGREWDENKENAFLIKFIITTQLACVKINSLEVTGL